MSASTSEAGPLCLTSQSKCSRSLFMTSCPSRAKPKQRALLESFRNTPYFKSLLNTFSHNGKATARGTVQVRHDKTQAYSTNNFLFNALRQQLITGGRASCSTADNRALGTHRYHLLNVTAAPARPSFIREQMSGTLS